MIGLPCMLIMDRGCVFIQHIIGNKLNGITTALPIRKPYGAAVFPLHEVLNSEFGDEKDIHMDTYMYVLTIMATNITLIE